MTAIAAFLPPERKRLDWGYVGAVATAAIGHVVAFLMLSLSFLIPTKPPSLQSPPIEVSLVEDVGLVATAPQATVPPAQSRAPDPGPPEDAPPPAPAEAAPAPVPPAPQPKPVPAPKPAETVKAKPAKPVPDTPKQVVKAPPRREATPATDARPTRQASTGTDAASTKPRPRGSRLGDDFLKGLTDTPSQSRSITPRAAVIDARALAGIQDAIRRQIQPCADRQVNPGPGANQIMTVLNLRLNPDGSLAATPTVVRQSGTNEENGRYSRRVVDLGIAAFKGCSPLKLPPEFYQTPSGGWNNINYNWQLR